jgi:capsular exopolysaccharide synthesis family protein
MSRLYNLFHGSERQAHQPSRTPSSSLSEISVPDSDVAVAEPIQHNFPKETAQFGPEHRLIFHTDPHNPAADRFRLLRMRLKEQWKAGKLKKLLVTSPLAGDGKSTVTLNLATALHERGKHSVLVVEADLHHSSISEMLKLRWAGLSECLTDSSVAPSSCIRQIEPFGWHLLPAGEPRRNPTELLQSPAFGRIMRELAPCFDWVLIDSPPVVPLTDSISLQQHADAGLLIVRAGKTPRETVEQSLELLGKKNILGIILNGVEIRSRQYYQYYGNNRPNGD